MMTSAASFAAGGGFQPTPLPPSDSEDSIGVASTATSASMRLVKRPLTAAFTADSCKKRRKQSTPIRISTGCLEASMPSDDNTNNGVDIAGPCEGKLGPFHNNSHTMSPTEPESIPPEKQLLSHIHIESLPTPDDCDGTVVSPDSPETSSPVNLSGGQSFPPSQSDIQLKTDDWFEASAIPVSSMNPMYLSASMSSVGHQMRNPGQPPIRIFNPEAYCELCNKEFCNKYFLKTHKANKHRIYSEPSTTADKIGLTVNVPSYTAAIKPIIPTISIVDIPKNAVDMSCTLNTCSNSNTSTGFLNNVFCEICGKGFANKILFNAHKITVHGIIMPEQLDQISENIDLNPLIPTVLSHTEERTQPDVTEPIINIAVSETVNILKNESFNEDGSVINPDDENSQNSGSISMMTPQLGSDPQDVQNIDFATNRLRRLGIMNPEAFCEICCKEYCNKYFLRTHKMKRHGIFIPDDNSKENQKDFKLELSIRNNWYQIQTSPLNLIMGEHNTNSSGSYGERKSSPLNENECETCGMKFQTCYLAQLHAATVHNVNNQFKFSAVTSNNATNEKQELGSSTTSTLSVNNNEKLASDTISEDLQKLQTMILQLNDLDVSRVSGINNSSNNFTRSSNYVCSMCGKEYENRYYLHAHLMTEHGMLLDNNPATALIEKSTSSESENIGTEMATCKFCGRDGLTGETLYFHTVECAAKTFPIATSSSSTIVTNTTPAVNIKKEESNGFVIPDKLARPITGVPAGSSAITAERRSSITLTPTNSYCEICNKELCNKYFMKTHMQRMHGIEIENGAQIGGVVCNICNKELCSKYFLRVHKHNTHGIVGEGTGGIMPRQNNIDIEPQSSTNPELPGTVTNSTDTALKPADLSDLSNRYFTHFTEVCTICSRRFRSTKWLKAHLLGDHGKAGTEKWNELELQLQQTFGQQQQSLQGKSNPGITDRISPTLRIPNGGSDSLKSESGMQNVLHSIFGTDDSNVKQYHCSFCLFSTPVLAFLFVHERSHSQNRSLSSVCDMEVMGPTAETILPASIQGQTTTPLSTKPGAISPLHCAVCNQTFRQPDQLHHHIVTQHSFFSLSNFFGGSNHVRSTQSTPLLLESKQEVNHLETDLPVKNQTSPSQEQINTSNNQCSKCTQFNNSGKHQNFLKTCAELSTDVTITLKDLSKLRQLPATYALPQQQQQIKYVMQAFLMDEPSSTPGNTEEVSASACTVESFANVIPSTVFSGIGEIPPCEDNQQKRNDSGNSNMTSSTDRKFAPSIVFLPVLEKLTAPLTVSFTLTPA